MREFSFHIEEPFTKGLRPEKTYLNREGFLEACFNMVPDEGGLKAYVGPNDPFQGGQVVDFPLPQAFLGRDMFLMFGTTSVDELNTSVSPWTKTSIDTKDPSNPSNSKAITSGGVWHFADLGEAWYAANGSCVVFRTGLGNLTATTTRVFVQDSVTVNTLTKFKGRMFLGGMSTSDVWSSDWATIFSGWTSSAATTPALSVNGPGKNWVMWSSIGGGDFPLWLFMPSDYTDAGQDPTAAKVLSKIKRNEFGWMPMRWPGTVQVLKPLGQYVIVYGDNGITALEPRGALIGKREISRFGVLGRGAVGGDERGHLFLDKEGTLWALGADLTLERIGHEEWFGSFPGSSTIVDLKPAPADQRDFFISSPNEGYIFNVNGLAEIPDRITSIQYLEGTFYALHTSVVSTDVRVQTSAFDNRRQALKTIHDLQIQYSDLTNIQVSVFYRYNHTEAFRVWGPISVSPMGIVAPSLTALEFKIRVTGTPGDNPRLDGVEVRWNLVDKRMVRGLFTEQ